MFPFLAPIKQPNSVERQGTVRFVEMTFLADSPYASRSNSAASAILPRNIDENLSQKSQSNEGLSTNFSSSPRPNSRSKSKTSLSSLPTSARSEKSSPLPPVAPVKEVIPPISRHKNKGLEMSAGMMELFGGESAFGPGSAFSSIPPNPPDRNFHRKNLLEKEFEQSKNHPSKSDLPPNTDSAYKSIENHEKAYERAIKRARGQDLSKPGPEWFEGFNRLDMADIDLPDPNCPAEKVLHPEKSDFQSDWRGTKEDVVLTSSTSKMMATSSKFESLPGPDIGAGVDDEEEAENEETNNVIDSRAEFEEKEDVEKKRKTTNGNDDVDGGGDGDGDGVGGGGGSGGSSSGGNRERLNSSSTTNSQNGEKRDSQENDRDGEDMSTTNASNKEEKAAAAAANSTGDMTLLLKNAQIINDDAIFVSDVLIQDGIISNVAPKIDAPDGVEVIDVGGRMLIPAGIDVHTHLTSQESADDLLIGCRAALAGGTATIVEVVTPRGSEGPLAAFKRVKQSLDKAICNVSISVSINNWNGSIKSDMEQLVADGVNSFVVGSIEDDKLFELLEHSRKLGAYIRLIPENRSIISILERKLIGLGVTGPEGYPQSRPEELEADRVNNLCLLSQLANCPVSIVSVSSAESLKSIEKARSSGALAHAEIATAAIASNGEKLLEKDLKIALAHLTEAPLRRGAEEKLVTALSNQPLIVATSGHKAIGLNAKLAVKDFVSAPKGSAGVEERMSIIWEKAVRSGKIDAMRFVAVTSTNAAKVFNMYPKKGRITIGADADLVIWDGNTKRVLSSQQSQSSVELTLFDGLTVHSTIIATIIGGKIAWKDGSIKNAPNVGYFSLTPNSPYLFSMVNQRDKFLNVEKVERSEENNKKMIQNGHQQQQQQQAPDFDRTRIRKHLMESSIDFGGNNQPTNRKPSAGRSTGLW